MHLDLDPDQQLFASSTRDFLSSSLKTDTSAADAESAFDPQWWAQGTELGWLATAVPESLGGGSISGEPLVELSLIAQSFGEKCAPGPLAVTIAVLTALARDNRHPATIEGIITGETIVTLAHYEPNLDWTGSTQTQLTSAPDGTLRLSGTKDRVEFADHASLVLVTATSADGPVLLLLDPTVDSVTVTPTWSLDPGRAFAQLRFADTPIDATHIVASGAAAASALAQARLVGAALSAAESCGVVQAMFDVTMQWLDDRYTFGRPLSSYQVLKHRMADNKTWLEASLAVTAAAFRALDAQAPNAEELVSAAKSYVGDKSIAILQDFVQMHGGLGVTWEHQLHLYLRRAVCNRALFGTPEDHRREIAANFDQEVGA